MTEHDDSVHQDLRGLALGTLLPGFEGTSAPSWLLDLLSEGLPGVVLFERNVDPAAGDDGVAALGAQLRAARVDCIVAIDEEGGDVTRLDATRGSDVPGAAALGVVDDLDLTRRVGASLGRRLRAAGVTVNLAPVADVDADPLSPIIGIRSFGTDPQQVARHVAAFVQGQQAEGIAATVKHFPGHGATAEDSHVTVPEVDASRAVLDARELVPFRAAIQAGVRVVMTAHVRFPALDDVPATLSASIVTGLLRTELGFDGVVMSDGLDMHAISHTVGHAEGAVRALAAGVDALCIGGESTGPRIVEDLVDAISAAVKDGRLSRERLVDANRRVRELAAQARGPAHAAPSDTPGREAACRAMRVRGVRPLARPPLVLECHDEPSIAAGEVPWAVGEPLAQRLPGTTVVVLTPQHPSAGSALSSNADRPVVLSVRGVRRRPWQESVLRDVRQARPDVVVVEHDLPGDVTMLGPQHICTISGSAVSAQAAADVLVGRAAYPCASCA